VIRFVSAQEMARIDRTAQEEYGIPGMLLMEQAGVKAFQMCCQTYPEKLKKASQMVFFAGKGNNGGDALVMAREAAVQGFSDITVIQLSLSPNETLSMHLQICSRMGIRILRWEEDSDDIKRVLSSCDVIFDGITGTGLTSPLRGKAKDAVTLMHSSRAFVISIDLPSGLYPESGQGDVIVKADCTAVMGLYKTSCWLPNTRKYCGELFLVNPGFPSSLLDQAETEGLVLEPDTDCVLPPVPPEAYKTVRGFVTVLAGSAQYPGAARLASQAAMATRAGMVSLLCDRELQQIMASSLWESIILQPPEEGIPERSTALLCGPGWGRDRSRDELLESVLNVSLPAVIDADALAVLARLRPGRRIDFRGNAVLTPHPGEFRMLTDDPSPVHQAAVNLAKELQAWIVYKTYVTLIAGPEGECFAADVTNPAMGTAGSGDVLSGIIAGLLAEGLSPKQAALTGVLLHYKAGKLAKERYGWFSSHQLLYTVSQVIFQSEGQDEIS